MSPCASLSLVSCPVGRCSRRLQEKPPDSRSAERLRQGVGEEVLRVGGEDGTAGADFAAHDAEESAGEAAVAVRRELVGALCSLCVCVCMCCLLSKLCV